MNYSVFIHGNCNGQQAGGEGSKGETGFIEKFYTFPYTYGCQFDIERRDNRLIYYSYIRAKNIIACDGRTAPSAYFAITVKSDAHFTDVLVLRAALEMAFENLCLGKILEKKETNFKFTVSDFDGQQGLCDSIDGLIAKALGGAVGLKRVVNDVKSFGAVNGASAKIYSGDATPNYIVSALKQCSHIVIADDIGLSKVAGKQFQELKQQCDSKVKEAEDKAAQTEKDRDEKVAQVTQEFNSKLANAERAKQDAVAQVTQQANAKIKDLNDKLANAEKEKKQANARIEDLNDKLANAEKEKKQANARIEDLNDKLANAEKEKKQANARIEDLDAKLANAENEKQEKVAQAKKQVEAEWNAKLMAKQKEIDELRLKLKDAETAKKTVDERVAKLELKLTNTENSIDSIKQNLSHIKTEIDKINAATIEEDKKKLVNLVDNVLKTLSGNAPSNHSSNDSPEKKMPTNKIDGNKSDDNADEGFVAKIIAFFTNLFGGKKKEPNQTTEDE